MISYFLPLSNTTCLSFPDIPSYPELWMLNSVLERRTDRDTQASLMLRLEG
uniref:Uncharacterized protein n=1 Tax=Meloidogyne incognita TaxID=6306 RepID=A0A914L8H2_MELIC